MLSTPSSSARRHASRSSAIVHCCGWMVTPTLNRRPPALVGGWASVMTHDLVPIEVDPNSADSAFWRRYHAFRRARHAETRPDDPLIPDEIAEIRLRRPRKFEIWHWYELADAGEMISWFRAETVSPTSPEYETNRDFLWANWEVRSDRRRQGIGSSWLPVVLELMDHHGCRTVTLEAEEESGHAFLRWLGAEAKSAGAENRLKLADVDWAMVKKWVADGEERNPETRLEIYDGHLPKSMWNDFAKQRTLLLNTMPFDDLDHGEIVVTPERLAEWYEHSDLLGDVDHTVLTRESDGSISGMTDVVWAPYRPTFVEQMLTGVKPETRGRGIGKWS